MIEDSQIAGAVIFLPDLVNIYGCEIGAGTTVAPFVEIQRGAKIGKGSKICSHAFVCGGTVIGDRVFIGHGVMFCNDRYPVIGSTFRMLPATVGDDVSIGSGAVIGPGVQIGQGAIVGAGAVVIHDVPAWSIVAGNPARVIRQFAGCDERAAHLEQYVSA